MRRTAFWGFLLTLGLIVGCGGAPDDATEPTGDGDDAVVTPDGDEVPPVNVEIGDAEPGDPPLPAGDSTTPEPTPPETDAPAPPPAADPFKTPPTGDAPAVEPPAVEPPAIAPPKL